MAKEEAPTSLIEPPLDSKVKQAREALVGMGLPLESVEQAVKKIHEFGGDLNAIASYALSLSTPQAECIEEHLSDDMISSDEETGDESKEKWIQHPSRAQSPQVQTTSEEVWVDPICRIFQNPPEAENLALTSLNAGSSAMAAAELSSVPAVMVKSIVTEVAEAGCSRQCSLEDATKREIEPEAPPQPPAHLQPSQRRERETFFLDMGFPFDLVQRAIRHHGLEADDSILLQFLIDYSKETNAAPRAQPTIDAEAEESDSDEELRRSVRQLVAERSLKTSAKSYQLPEGKDSDSDSGNEAGISSDFAKPSPLCSREIPENGGHKAAMESLGFPPALIERAVQELGQGVEYDMLLEYLLYLSAQPDPEASTSVNPSRCREDNTLEKLTTEFQFPTMAVEKAMGVCRTPLWNASHEQIIDVVDFLAAHMEDLLQEDPFGGKSNLPDSDDSDTEEDEFLDWGEEGLSRDPSCWNQEGGGKSGKRKLDERGKEPVHSGWPGRPKGSVSGARLKKPTSISKAKSTAPVALSEINKQRCAIGFGLPGQPIVKHRCLKEDVKGAPFFYFENVAGMPVGEWKRIQMHLFDIEPEFVDAMHFSACRRSRGYIHNLPIEGRKKLIKDPPMTIMDLMPQTKPFWPEWDKRTKLNCINTVRASEFLSKRLGIVDGTGTQKLQLSIEEQKNYLKWCCKLNLVWTSPNIPSPVEADEIEAMLGFDKDHSRHCFSHTARYKALGNSFSVFTVAYHFSVLKPLYPKGIKVLSLFSGIGGAEVALHKVGINLNVVVSVEIEEGARRCLQTWWALTNQKGYLDLDYHDVRQLTRDVLSNLVDKYRGFDFIVGGSPCNNFTGNNRHTRIGLDAEAHGREVWSLSDVLLLVHTQIFVANGLQVRTGRGGRSRGGAVMSCGIFVGGLGGYSGAYQCPDVHNNDLLIFPYIH